MRVNVAVRVGVRGCVWMCVDVDVRVCVYVIRCVCVWMCGRACGCAWMGVDGCGCVVSISFINLKFTLSSLSRAHPLSPFLFFSWRSYHARKDMPIFVLPFALVSKQPILGSFRLHVQ